MFKQQRKSNHPNLRHICIAVVAAVTVSIAAPVAAADVDAATAACDAADTARKAAAEVGMEWRDIRKSIKKARKMIEKGETEDAIKVCDLAVFQSEAGVAQAEKEKNSWMGRVPK